MEFWSAGKESMSQGAISVTLGSSETEFATVIDHIDRISTHFPKVRGVCYIAEWE